MSAPETYLVKLSGELDIAGVESARDELQRAGSSQTAILDLSAVTFIDSIGLGIIVFLKQRMAEHGGSVRLVVEPHQDIARIISASGLDQVVNVYPSVALATP